MQVNNQTLTPMHDQSNEVHGPPPAPKPRATQEQNQVTGQPGGQSSEPNAAGATGGARETTEPAKTGWRAVAEEVEERLNADSDYLEIKAKLDANKGMADDFALVDKACWWGSGDGLLGLADIESVAKDPHQSQEARDAASRLLQSMAVFNEAANGNQQLTNAEVMEFLNKLKADVAARKAAMTEKVEVEHAKRESTSPARSGPAAGSSTATGGTSAGATPITPSTQPGIEGAMENLGNVADSLQAQMLELANQAAADPSKAVALQQQIAQLQGQYQAITNMMNQLTQMISNLSKMWSDVAMNSIRNVK